MKVETEQVQITPTDTDEVLIGQIKKALAAHKEAKGTTKKANTEVKSRAKVVGELLLKARKRHPKLPDFLAFIGRVHDLKRSRAYDFMRIAGGRITEEELREAGCKRVRKHRAAMTPPARPEPQPDSVTSPDVTEPPKPNPLSDRKPAPKVNTLNEFTVACRYWVPKIPDHEALDGWRIATETFAAKIPEADRQEALELVTETFTDKKAKAA